MMLRPFGRERINEDKLFNGKIVVHYERKIYFNKISDEMFK